MGITKTDIKALQLADSIVFHHDRPENRSNGKAGRIRCIKRTKAEELERDPFAPQDREYKMEVDSWVSISYDAKPDYMTMDQFRDKIRGSEVMSTYNAFPGGNTLSSVIGLLRPDDELKLKWYYGNDNGYTEKAGLHCDQLELEIRRPTKTRTKVMTFLLRVGVCEDNTARMLSSWY